MPSLSLLGPQRRRPTVAAAVRRIGGPIAVITAGWRENEDDPLPRGLRRRSTNLSLHRQAEEIFDEDRELFAAHRDRQLELRQLQKLYRLRLDHAVAAYRELASLPGDADRLLEARRSALDAVRALDREHLDRVDGLHRSFAAEWKPAQRDSVADRRRVLAEQIDSAASVVISGGHIAALLNRLRLFDLGPLLAEKPLIAWSAGAMALCQRIVLFHDSPPWGAGNAEVLESGLACCGDLLPLPDAHRRLRLHDPARVALLAGRFAPLLPVGLDAGSQICRDAGEWRARDAVRLHLDGRAEPLGSEDWETFSP